MKVLLRNGQIMEGSFEEKQVREAFWHTGAHILAQAVKRLYPEAKCAIGPAIENGFYYDFAFGFPFGEEHLAAVEAQMKQIVKESLSLQVYEMSREEALKHMEEADEPYKLELIRELPLRVGELGIIHRNEKSGTLHGLMRVRCCTQDDAHIFMMEEQIIEEIQGVARLIDEVYAKFGFEYAVELSTRPENSIGRTWQCGTIQLDFQLPRRFGAEYIGADGEKHRPIMIHRVIFGSIERFIGILIEHYAGKFPMWLAPVQVKLLPVSEKYFAYGKQVCEQLKAKGLRVEMDKRNEKLGYKSVRRGWIRCHTC